MKKAIYLLILFGFFQASAQRTYNKTYFNNGKIQSEGWMSQNQKVDYWFYYYENGTKKEEGHYQANKKCKWWIFYNPNKEIDKKSEFDNDQLNGFSIFYKKNKIIRAEKYVMGKKTKEWNSISEFKKDNTIFF
jgi:antitoxin component YwqK of YwqJK toxin-antitoxin module